MQTITLGPLVLPLPLLLGIGAFAVANVVARRTGGTHGADVERRLLRLLLVGLVAARAAFVLKFHDAYSTSPLDILDIRDGGWHAPAGVAAALVYAAAVLANRPALRKPMLAAAGAGATLWLAGAVLLAANAPDEVRMPQLSLPALDGTPVALAGFEGRPTVVNLWATWCPPCRREMPVLHKAQASRPDVNFVFVNQGEAPAQVQTFLRQSGLPLHNVLLDARGEAAAALGYRALPTTLFFDARGRLVDTRVGELSQASLAERLATVSSPAQKP